MRLAAACLIALALLPATLPARADSSAPARPAALAKPTPQRWADESSGMALEYVAARRLLVLRGADGAKGAERAQALARLLQRHRAELPPLAGHTLLFGPYPELGHRMAVTASCRPAAESAPARLPALLARARAWRELDEALAPQALGLQVAELEGVLRCRPDELDPALGGPPCPMNPPRPLPCGASVRFRIVDR